MISLLSDKNLKRVLKLLFSLILLAFPLFTKIYYQNVYYLVAGLFILALIVMDIFDWNKKREENFFLKWPQKREKGFWNNFILTSLSSLAFMSIIVSIGQFFGNGRTPIDIYKILPTSGKLNVLVILIIFSSILGVIDWYEKKSKYQKMYHKKQADKGKEQEEQGKCI